MTKSNKHIFSIFFNFNAIYLSYKLVIKCIQINWAGIVNQETLKWMFPSLKKLLGKRKKNKNRQYNREIKMIHMQINIMKYFTF